MIVAMPAPTMAPAPATGPQPAPQTAERSVHVVRKPQVGTTTMLRDASVWGYSDSAIKSKSPSVPPTAKSDWPTTIDLPDASPAVMPQTPASVLPLEQSPVLVKVPQDKEAPKATAQPAAATTDKHGMETLTGNVGWTHVGGGNWVLKADGKEYLLKGDDSILRLRVGDKVEVSGVVKPSGTLGMTSVVVEKVSFSAKR